jgi:hypothetical protein
VFSKSPSVTIIEALVFNAFIFQAKIIPSRASVPTARHNNSIESPSKRTFIKRVILK